MHLVHRGGDDQASGVSHSGHCAGQVDEVHYFAAQQIAQAVCVVGKRKFGVIGV
jgi:hypothetical protein